MLVAYEHYNTVIISRKVFCSIVCLRLAGYVKIYTKDSTLNKRNEFKKLNVKYNSNMVVGSCHKIQIHFMATLNGAMLVSPVFIGTYSAIPLISNSRCTVQKMY